MTSKVQNEGGRLHGQHEEGRKRADMSWLQTVHLFFKPLTIPFEAQFAAV
jgi:hypothetical protein